MANRKEDEKNERIIRNLLKLADNRRCINCSSLGPQYVCTNFWTFVCTACSGIHREFTHRVKSISMAKFTSQEVSALEGGGNVRAKAIYFKEWDPQRNSIPDSSNIERLRDFIKHVYVDRRFTGDKSFDKPPRANMGESSDSIWSGSQSPPYRNPSQYSDRPTPGGRRDDRDFRNSYDERSPGHDRISPARTEIVNDWRREDRFGNGKKSDDGRISDGRSPGRDSDLASTPVVRPVREILGDNVSPLRIIEPPKANSGRVIDGSVQPQRTTSSTSLASSNGNPTEIKSNTLGSLIDLDDAPDPPKIAPESQPQPTGSGQSVFQPTTLSSTDNWACFDSPAEKKVTQAPTLNTLDSLFSGLSDPAPVSNVTMFPPVSAPSASPFSLFAGGNVPPPAQVISPSAPNGINPPAVVANGSQRPTMPPQQYSGFPGSGVQSLSQPFMQQVGGPSNNQLWNSSFAPVGPGAPSIPAGQSLQAVARPGVDVAPGGVNQSSSVKVKPTGRQALPEDLFAPTYPQFSVRPWQTGPPHGFAYNMPYNAVMPTQIIQHSTKSTNPFDFGNDLPPVQAPTFPSLASLQGTLPNLPAQTNTTHNSQLWGPPQSSYPSAMPPPAQSFSSPMAPGTYMGQQMPNNLFPGQGLGGEGTPNQQLGGMFFPPASQNNFYTVGGNPFG